MRCVRVETRSTWLAGMTAGLQFGPVAIIGLLGRLLAIALLRKTSLKARDRLLLPAIGLLRGLLLGLRMNPGGLGWTLLACGASDRPPGTRPRKRVLRGHRETP